MGGHMTMNVLRAAGQVARLLLYPGRCDDDKCTQPPEGQGCGNYEGSCHEAC